MQQIVFFHNLTESELRSAIKEMQKYGVNIKGVSVYGKLYKDYAVLYEYNCNLNDVVNRIEKLKEGFKNTPLDE